MSRDDETEVAILGVRGGLDGEGGRVVGAVTVCESKPEREAVEVGVRLPEAGTEFAPVRVARPSLLSFNSER